MASTINTSPMIHHLNLPCITCHVPPAMDPLPCTAYPAPPAIHYFNLRCTTYAMYHSPALLHLPCTICHALPALHHLPCITCHAPPALHHLLCTTSTCDAKHIPCTMHLLYFTWNAPPVVSPAIHHRPFTTCSAPPAMHNLNLWCSTYAPHTLNYLLWL